MGRRLERETVENESNKREQEERDSFSSPGRWVSGLFSYSLNTSAVKGKHVFLCFLMCCSPSLSSCFMHGSHTSCNVTLEERLHQWRLVCQFPEDLSNSKKDFQVHHIKHTGATDLLLDAVWIEEEPAVFTKSGCFHDGSVSDKVVVWMSEDVVHRRSIYACTFSQQSLENLRTCEASPREEAAETTTAEYLTSSAGYELLEAIGQLYSCARTSGQGEQVGGPASVTGGSRTSSTPSSLLDYIRPQRLTRQKRPIPL